MVSVKSISKGSRVLGAISVVGMVTVAGCARHGLSADDASSLIKRYRADHCRVEEVSVRSKDIANRGAKNFPVSLLQGTKFARRIRARVQSGFGTFTTESLQYRDDDGAQSVELTEMRYPNASDDDRIVLRACLFLPTKIEISDLVFESSKTANVLFTEHLGLSLLARNLEREHLLGPMTGNAPSEAHEFHLRLATLGFDERAGSWVVTSIVNGG
jgi:hypothetical protein